MIPARLLASTAVVLALLMSASPVRAGDGSERAGAIFKQAQQAFERKDYAAAAAAFEQAAQLAPHAAAWLNAGESWERDGNLARAAEACDRALALETLTEVHRREAEVCLRRLVPKVGTLDVRSARTVVVKIDGAQEVTVPVKHRIAPGKHELVVLDLASSPMRSLVVEVARGETMLVDLTPPAAPPAPARPLPPPPPPESPVRASAPPAPEPKRGPPLVSFLAFGATVAAAMTGGIAGVMTLSARSNFNSDPTEKGRDDFYRARTVTNVAWAVAGVTAAAGVLVWTLDGPRGTSSRVGVAFGASGVTLAHETRF